MVSQVEAVDLTGDGKDEIIVVLTPAQSEASALAGNLLVFGQTGGWTAIFQAGAQGGVKLLAAGDVNTDGHPDIVWEDMSCGAHTCFATIHVMSWTGVAFQNWMNGALVMASPEIKLQDVTNGSGREIVAHGGVIGSVGAGPQRAWTETWSSLGGAPYALTNQVYDLSPCLYHTVLDANQALLNGRPDRFNQAVTFYRKAVDDSALEACWEHPNELTELRTFSAFRLAMAYAYQGDLANASATVADLETAYPSAIYAQIADVWWAAYQPTQDMAAACAAVSAFVSLPAHSEAFEMLVDYGYGNPSFTAADVCPIVP
jgi:hypothetical protein